MRNPAVAIDGLEKLRTMLATASSLVAGLANDPQRDRFLRLYDRIPLEDRAVLLDVLEREVSLRVATLGEGETLTGCGARPNPHARLYVRVIEKTPTELAPLDHEQMVYSNLRSARIMRLALAPAIYDRWRASVVEAFALLDAEQRRDVARVVRELQAILAQLDESAPPDDGA